ncbi:MAG: queuosine precursor transporter [Bacteroidota bacterium]|nr:queuosine precursor transporter [Bacteroidota bacterium]
MTHNQVRKDNMFMLLGGIFLTNALIAEMIGPKIFSLEKMLGIPPVGIQLGTYTLDFNLTAGVIIWPFVFIVSDIINEYFGIKGVRKISYATAGFIAFAFIIVYIATLLPPATFWMEINKTDVDGNAFNINYAFSTIFRQGLGIILGSLTAFLIGQIVDATIFGYIRIFTKDKMIWLRATGSTVISQLIDSYIVLTIAFYFFGNWPLEMVLAVGTINFIYKIGAAIILIPLLYIGHFFIDKYLAGKDS